MTLVHVNDNVDHCPGLLRLQTALIFVGKKVVGDVGDVIVFNVREEKSLVLGEIYHILRS